VLDMLIIFDYFMACTKAMPDLCEAILLACIPF
jgi:hypothetical protein